MAARRSCSPSAPSAGCRSSTTSPRRCSALDVVARARRRTSWSSSGVGGRCRSPWSSTCSRLGSGIASGPAVLATRLGGDPAAVAGDGARRVGRLRRRAVLRRDPAGQQRRPVLARSCPSTSIATAAIFGWGMYIGSRRELMWTLRHRAERAESEQELRVEQARANERARIAREMHDVLAHRISQVSMHAGALAFREDLTPDAGAHQRDRDPGEGARGADRPARRPRGAARRRRRAGARAAADVRRPGRAGRGGPRVRAQPRRSTTGSAPPAEVPDAAGRTLYRIVQEGITNARKHAPRQPAHRRAHRLARGRARRGDAQPVRLRQRHPGLRARAGRASPSVPSCAAAGSTYRREGGTLRAARVDPVGA